MSGSHSRTAITLDRVSFLLPDGSPLFSGLDGHFDDRRSGLVGRNGVGKSVLARIIAGELAPTAGQVMRHGRVRYVAQFIDPAKHRRVADVAGIGAVVDALARIERGSTSAADFDIVGERWDLRRRLEAALAAEGLGHLDAETPAAGLSGGECTRVALLGAFVDDAEVLILDEPSNHLDASARDALYRRLTAWRRALIVISHDRAVLDRMEAIVELGRHGLQRHGGDYGCYATAKARATDAAAQALAHARTERRRGEAELRRQQERLAQRAAQGQRSARDANQARILLDRAKERSEHSSARLRASRENTRKGLDAAVHAAAAAIDDSPPTVLLSPAGTVAAGKQVAVLEGVRLPYGRATAQALDLVVSGPRRIALCGPNGCGKSTLLKLLAGQLAPAQGRCTVTVPSTWVDQALAGEDGGRPALAALLAANPALGEAQARTRLALLGLDARRALAPATTLSGGERLKAALACALYAEPPARLLLLDEPTNHIDLPSLQAVEEMLRAYRGALLVVSHDHHFLDALALTDVLQWTPQGWQLRPRAAEAQRV